MKEPVIIMPCLDMRNGRVVKGVHFVDIADAGDPVECARAYCAAGADELALLDITATVENRGTLLDVVRRVAEVCTVPFTVGGGISDVRSASQVLEAGANKVSTSSAAFRKPEIIPAMIREFGPGAVTVAIDVDVNPALPSGYEVYIDGGADEGFILCNRGTARKAPTDKNYVKPIPKDQIQLYKDNGYTLTQTKEWQNEE